MKILRKIRLINWHRFENETIELSESVLLSGENGAGKSTILDAVQYVMTGSKANFNKAAHEKGKRNLGSYIRCKTGREDKPYERTGALSAHIALEFYEESKKKPFIVGVVMDSYSEEKEPVAAWYLMENRTLRDEYFFKGKQVRGITSFRAIKDIRTWAPTIAEARKMMLSRFGRIEDKFFSLIPKALAFKPIHDIKDFVYSYVLDEKEVNIDTLRENVRSYQELEKMLQNVRKRIAELERITEKEQEIETYDRRDRHQEYYIRRAHEDLTAEKILLIKEEIRSEKGLLSELEKKQVDAGGRRDSKEVMIRNLSVELQSDTEYKAFTELERREADLRQLLRDDRAEVRILMEAVKKATAQIEDLIRFAAAQRKKSGDESSDGSERGKIYEYNAIWNEYLDFLTALPQCESIAAVAECTERIIEYKNRSYQALQTELAILKVEKRDRLQKMEELRARITQLESKRLVYRPEVVELQRRIAEQFRRAGRSSEVRILCELLEIKDPEWLNAVEGYLNTQRFYLIVEPQDFDIALSVYDRERSKKRIYGVGLVNTASLEEYDRIPEGSLAEKVDSANVWARRYVNMVLGKVHCCASYQELKNYPVSITRECMRYQNHVVSAIPPSVYKTPYIGAAAYKVQLLQCREEEKHLSEQLSGLQSREKALEGWGNLMSTVEDIDVKYRLKALENQRLHENKMEECRQEMKKLRASRTFIEKKVRLEEMEREKRLIEKELSDLSEKIGMSRQKIKMKEEEQAASLKIIEEQKEICEQLTDRLGEEKELCREEYDKLRKDRTPAQIIDNYERSRKANQTLRDSAEKAMCELMRAYKVAYDFGAAATEEGYPEFLEEYDKLKNSKLLEYEDKVYRARQSAEEEFREQFLSRLQENIREAQTEFKELNKALRDIRFSREQYEFRYEPRRNLRKFYDMIMDDFNVLQGVSIFSGMFNEIHKEVIEELFEKLTLDDESSAKTLQEYTDYRTYMDYDIKITLDDGSYMYYSKVSREKSGGETQTPFYITVAASFMQLYRGSIGGDSIGLIMLDEAFNNMDDERIAGVLSFMNNSNLQTIIAAPPDKIQYIGPAVKSVLLVMQDDNVSYVEDFSRMSRT